MISIRPHAKHRGMAGGVGDGFAALVIGDVGQVFAEPAVDPAGAQHPMRLLESGEKETALPA